ncbi:putative superinfection immunity protein [Lachnospiraceae bacterium KM106-2]|nr:putative superinfection immunity protein [Lachnospiraceae bacterium KM106-2]
MKEIKGKRIARIMVLSLFIGLFSMTGVITTQPVTNTPVVTEVKAATMGQKNALRRAKNYLSIMAFSKKGLIKQLKFEGYTTKEANYAVKHCKANWKKQAVKKAKNYLDMMSFSKSGLLKQLKFEGFTTAEAKYAIKKVYK